ncbi:hypothetical protein GOODEAATRI_030539, partial [Goodea atripinnis]
GIRGLAGSLMTACRAEMEGRPGGEDQTEERCRKAGGLDDAVFGQVAELHVAKGFPWAHHCDVSAETLHAGDVVSKAAEAKRKAIRFCALVKLF